MSNVALMLMNGSTEGLSELDIHVPVNGAMETITIDRCTSWDKFVSMLADTMEVSPKTVSVAYRFSVQAQNTPYSHLSTPKHYAQLFPLATATKKASRSKKPFAVELKDMSGAKDKGGSKQGKGKANTKKGKRKRKVRPADFTTLSTFLHVLVFFISPILSSFLFSLQMICIFAFIPSSA